MFIPSSKINKLQKKRFILYLSDLASMAVTEPGSVIVDVIGLWAWGKNKPVDGAWLWGILWAGVGVVYDVGWLEASVLRWSCVVVGGRGGRWDETETGCCCRTGFTLAAK